ncbi:hypothetical protein EDD86DRAFT_202866 [Gorgonomyces haynaldii]|nr:hypothetical protein EDD86DRAFT_202866 [Gorgonomyces haynaldii]
MFESIVSLVVNQILGEYISNLETNQLELGIWSGDVVLHNLKLKKDIFSKMRIPVDIQEGFVGDLTLSIPWSDLKGKPLKIGLQNVYVVANLQGYADYDPEQEEEDLQAQKQTKLKQFEELKQQKQTQEQQSYFGPLIATIVDNVQISIKNIHIRFEDVHTTPENPFAVGVTLKELSVVSTNGSFQMETIDPQADTIYKLLKMQSFGVYCSTDNVVEASPVNLEGKTMAEKIKSSVENVQGFQYILDPVSGEGKLQWIKGMDPKRPKYDLSVSFGGIDFNLDDKQYSTFISLFGALSRQTKAYPYRKYRPPRTITPKLDPKAWFKYAGQCVLSNIHERNRTWTWSYFAERKKQRLSYIELYNKLKLNIISQDEIYDLDELEAVLPFEDIRFYRQLASRKMKERPKSVQATQEQGSGTWMGWIGSMVSTSPQQVDPEKELQQLYDTLDLNPDDYVTISDLPLDAVFLKLTCTVLTGSFTIKKKKQLSFEPLATTKFSKFSFGAMQYPQTIDVTMDILDMIVKEVSTIESPFQEIIKPKKSTEDPNSPFFSLQFSHLPLDKRADDAVRIRMLPLQVMLNPQLLDTIFAFFKVDQREFETLSSLQAAAQGAFAGVTAQTRAGLEFAISEHKTIDVNVDIDAPIVYIPTQNTISDCSMLVIDAGHFTVRSDLIKQEERKKRDSLSGESFEKLVDYIYDKFTFSLNALQVFVIPSYETRGDVPESSHILERLDLSVGVEKCIIPNAREFAAFKVNAGIARFHVNVSHANVKCLQDVLSLVNETFGSEQPIEEIEWKPVTEKRIDSIESFYDAVDMESKRSSTVSEQLQELLHLNFEFQEASLTVYEIKDDGKLDVLSVFAAKGISAELFHYPKESRLGAKIQDLVFEDARQTRSEFKYLMARSNLESEIPLIKLDCQYVNNPNAYAKSTLDVRLDLTPIKFMFVQDAMLQMYRFVTQISTPPTPMTPALPRSRTPSAKAVVQESMATVFTIVLNEISVILVENGHSICHANLGTLSLTGKLMGTRQTINGTIGKVSITDLLQQNGILTIDDSKTAEFVFEKFDPRDSGRSMFDSTLNLNAASMRLFYDDQFTSRLSAYFGKFNEMKDILDGASKAAQESALQMQKSAGKTKFNVTIKTPIIEVPKKGNKNDRLVFYLGKISAKSVEFVPSSSSLQDKIVCQVTSLKLQSVFGVDDKQQILDMVEDVNLDINLMNYGQQEELAPTQQIRVKTNDIVLKITDKQYMLFMDIYRDMQQPQDPQQQQQVLPFRRAVEIILPMMSLEVFWETVKFESPEPYSLARFVGHASTFKFESQANQSELEWRFQSFSLFDTRTKRDNIFRDIMIPMNEVEDQFVLRYRTKGPESDYLFTIDRAKLILELDHLFAIRAFAVSPFQTTVAQPEYLQDSKQNDNYNCMINFVDPEIVLVRQPSSKNSDAVIMMADQLTIHLDVVTTVSFKALGMFFCAMDSRKDTQIRFLDNTNITVVLDSQESVQERIYNASINTTKLLFRVSYQDILLIQDLYSRIFSGDSKTEQKQTIVKKSKESLRVYMEGLQAVIIDDINDLHVPMFEFILEKSTLEALNWSTQLSLDYGVSVSANYFNLKNSHWEPFIEKWKFSVSAKREDSKKLMVDFFCRQKLELNLTHVLIDTVLNATREFSNEKKTQSVSRSNKSPYVIRNRTGYSMHVWTVAPGSGLDTDVILIEDGKDLEWRFDDWRTMRERTAPAPNALFLQLHGPPWETVRGIHVDQEGTHTYLLRPAVEKITHMLVCDVEIKQKVKYVTLRSSTSMVNATSVPMEVMLYRKGEKSVPKIYQIPPGESFSPPIEASFTDIIKVRPFGFGYDWSQQGIHWKNIGEETLVVLVTCASYDKQSPTFRFQLNSEIHTKGKGYPHLTMKFMPPFILENLLPFDFKYMIIDKSTKQEHRSVLKQGQTDPLHTLDPTHLLALTIGISDPLLRQREVAIITSTELQYRDEHLAVYDQMDRQLNLRIKYTDLKSHGRIVTIYTPYLLLNKTGLPMEFTAKSLITSQRSVAGQGMKRDVEQGKVEPILFSYSTFEPLQSRTKIKVNDSQWSKALSFEAVGSSFSVAVPKQSEFEYQVGVNIQEGGGNYYSTKIVTFAPRFYARNNVGEDLYFRQAGTMSQTLFANGSELPIMELKKFEQLGPQMCIRLSQSSSEWSNPFAMDDLGTIFVKMGRLDSEVEDLIRVDIALENATLFLSFSKQDKKWPILIENQTDEPVTIRQTNAKRQYFVGPKDQLPYAWDYPSLQHKALILTVNGVERHIETSQLGKLMPIKYPIKNSNRNGVISIDLLADGPTIILRLSPYSRTKSKYIMEEKSQDKEFTLIEDEAKILQIVQVRLEGIGISFVSRNAQEIAYATLKAFVFVFTDTETDRSVSTSLKWLQIDNQMYGCMEPILLYPTVVPNDDQEEDKPVFLATLSQSKDTSHGVDYFHWFVMLLQELSIDLDEEFLYAAMDFFNFQSNSQELEFYDQRAVVPFHKSAEATDRLYFEKLLLQPIQINLSFSRIQSAQKDKSRPRSSGMMTFIYDVLSMTIGNITDAPIRLKALELEHPILSRSQLMSSIFSFYYQEILGQVHSIIGAADFLGNPVGLFNTVASGVSDMFYEPIQGFQITKPQEFGIGVAKGASSLVKKTVFGLSDTFSKLTGSLGKGLSVMTMDEKFQERRRLANRNKPDHLVVGVTSGAASLIRSVTSGVTGVISQPFKGAQESGVEGFFKGLGKGLVGVVTKPMIGLVDMATNMSDGIKNTTTVFDNTIQRQRLPRYVGGDGILKSYNAREALGLNWLKGLDNGRFFQEVYVAHLELRMEDLVCIVTERRVILARVKSLRTEWDVQFQDLQIVRGEQGSICLVHKERTNARQRMIPCVDPTSYEWLKGKIEQAFGDYIQRARSDE